MKRVLEPDRFHPARDGTRVAPVLNPWDANAHSIALDAFAGASLAVGEILPGHASRPHLHPLVTQLTWVLDGRLHVRMKEPSAPEPYELDVGTGAGVLTEPMTFLQLVNADATRTARVLYVVTPAYVHLPGEDGYDDAVVFDASWDELARGGFSTRVIGDRDLIRRNRASAQDRLAVVRSRGTRGAEA
jgi:hypothetical protein